MSSSIAIIPARKGSKGVPGKNTKPLAGKPLISYTIDAALKVFQSNQICVSTNDQKVIEIAESKGIQVPFKRPKELSSDTSGMDAVIRHAIKNFSDESNFDTIVLLQPTSPFRTSSHIKEALEYFTPEDDMIVSVKYTKSNPYYSLFEEDEFGYLQKSKNGYFQTRQECPNIWEYNGAIYIINAVSFEKKALHELNKIKKYVMNELDSLDIDSPHDWQLAETIIKKSNH